MKSAQTLVENAMARVSTLDLQQAQTLWGQENVQFVDLRELGELQRDGIIPGAFHAPRGLLEFWFDSTSGTGKPALTRPGVRYVLFCAAGWRSALAALTLQQMGVDQVCHIAGGFSGWKAAGAPCEVLDKTRTLKSVP